MCVTQSLPQPAGIPAHAAAILAQARSLLDARTQLVAALGLFNTAQIHGAPVADCAAGRWMCWMLLGQFERAWQESDLLDCAGAPDPNRLWDRVPFDGRCVLVRALHGYGDAVQFIRYAPLIRRRARRLVVQCHPDLLELLCGVDGVDEASVGPTRRCRIRGINKSRSWSYRALSVRSWHDSGANPLRLCCRQLAGLGRSPSEPRRCSENRLDLGVLRL